MNVMNVFILTTPKQLVNVSLYL